MKIQATAYPRAALAGNPSDGYNGKTISFAFTNFRAKVTLEPADVIEIAPGLHGDHGGMRLLHAMIKRFCEYCEATGRKLHDHKFAARYESNIPMQVGLAGSSAIITACLRCLMKFYHVKIPKPEQANLVWLVEDEDLGIPAGLQDRVAQVYQGLVYMDFDRERMERDGHGFYESLDPALLPPVYVAYREDLAEGTEIFHNNIRARWEAGERAVVEAMENCAALAREVRAALVGRRGRSIGPLLDQNFDARRKIYQISGGNIQMVETARAAGASANFAGSGGAIVGTFENDAMFERLSTALAAINVRTLKPDIALATGESG